MENTLGAPQSAHVVFGGSAGTRCVWFRFRVFSVFAHAWRNAVIIGMGRGHDIVQGIAGTCHLRLLVCLAEVPAADMIPTMF